MIVVREQTTQVKPLITECWRERAERAFAQLAQRKLDFTLECQFTKTGVGVEKVHFPQNSENLGDRKCLGKSRKSFVGHPDAILFLRISQKGVFQQPQKMSSVVELETRNLFS